MPHEYSERIKQDIRRQLGTETQQQSFERRREEAAEQERRRYPNLQPGEITSHRTGGDDKQDAE